MRSLPSRLAELFQSVPLAATIMFQQARRIGEVQPKHASFRELATLQCQSYLAAVNALSLVAEEHAWIAVVSTRDGTDRVSTTRAACSTQLRY